MVRLPRMLLTMLRYARDRLLELCDAPTEAPEELLNSGIGVLTREDESIHNLESLSNRSNSTQQLKKDKCSAELCPAIAKKNDFGTNHCLGVQYSEKEKEEIYRREVVNIKLEGILGKLVVSQDYAFLARQWRQEGIPSVDTLQGLVSLIFENAVMYPSQCAKYAKLCVLLSKLELPEFPGDKKITFRSVLLNACQGEFEKFTKPKQAGELDDEKEKPVKLWTLGIIKLIGELFNEKLLSEKIMHACIQELLGYEPNATPAENVEVLCHLLTTAGKKLEESTQSKMALHKYFTWLKVIGESTALPSQIQQMVRDVFDLRAKNCVSPQEEMKAKKINMIPAKAKIEQRPETMALRKVRPAATPKLSPGDGGMAPGMYVVPSILGMPGGIGPVQHRKASVDKEALLSVPVARSAPSVKLMEFGAGRVAAMPKPRVRDHFGVRANKDNFNLRDLLRRVQTFDK